MRRLFCTLLICAPIAAVAASPRTSVLDIQNMTCPTCSITIRRALENLPGVIDARVDYNHKTATVRYDPAKTNGAALEKATTNAGFPAKVHTVRSQ
jgi:mercuric ion binding protein